MGDLLHSATATIVDALPPAAAVSCVLGLTLTHGPFPRTVERVGIGGLVILHFVLGRSILSSPPLTCALGSFFTRWPRLLPEVLVDRIPRLFLAPGVFGAGGAKVLDALVMAVLFPRCRAMGTFPSAPVVAFVVTGTLTVFAVLQTWAQYFKPSFSSMPETKKTVAQKNGAVGPLLRAAALAAVNGTVEEIPFRGLLLLELMDSGIGATAANVCQAVSFGALHWRGIPSGWPGVGLTTIYGLVMGWLAQTTGGLATPVVAHAVADFFIFAVLVGGRSFA